MFLNNYFRIKQSAFRLLILACACFTTATYGGSLPLVSDLAATAKTAREQRVPVFVAFTLKRCPYCNTARRDYWTPMNSSEPWRGKVVMVEIMLDGAPALRDFDGQTTTARDFARRFNVRSAPTVIVFDTTGKPAASPVVGLASADFYAHYLEQAVEAGLARVRAAK